MPRKIGQTACHFQGIYTQENICRSISLKNNNGNVWIQLRKKKQNKNKNLIREENMVSASRQAWLTADYIHTGWSPFGLLTSKSNGVQRKPTNDVRTRICWRMRDEWEPPSYDRWYFGQRIVILTRIESSDDEEKTTTATQKYFGLPLRFCDCFSVEGFRSKLRCTCPFEFVPLETLDHLLLSNVNEFKKKKQIVSIATAKEQVNRFDCQTWLAEKCRYPLE